MIRTANRRETKKDKVPQRPVDLSLGALYRTLRRGSTKQNHVQHHTYTSTIVSGCMHRTTSGRETEKDKVHQRHEQQTYLWVHDQDS